MFGCVSARLWPHSLNSAVDELMGKKQCIDNKMGWTWSFFFSFLFTVAVLCVCVRCRCCLLFFVVCLFVVLKNKNKIRMVGGGGGGEGGAWRALAACCVLSFSKSIEKLLGTTGK